MSNAQAPGLPVQINVRLDALLLRRLKRLAKDHGLSMSDVIRVLVRNSYAIGTLGFQEHKKARRS